jgi:hypothetical protein
MAMSKCLALVLLITACAHHKAAPATAKPDDAGKLAEPPKLVTATATAPMQGPFKTMAEAPPSLDTMQEGIPTHGELPAAELKAPVKGATIASWGTKDVGQIAKCSLVLQLDDGFYISTPVDCDQPTGMTIRDIENVTISMADQKVTARYSIRKREEHVADQVTNWSLECSLAASPPTCTLPALVEK